MARINRDLLWALTGTALAANAGLPIAAVTVWLTEDDADEQALNFVYNYETAAEARALIPLVEGALEGLKGFAASAERTFKCETCEDGHKYVDAITCPGCGLDLIPF